MISDEMLSAFLDGELPDEDSQKVERALEQDPELQAQMEVLMEADGAAKIAFAEMAAEPVPFGLAAAIHSAPEPEVANVAAPARSGWMVAAAIAGALGIGVGSGFFVGQSGGGTQVATARGWLAEITDYHGVYAKQVRHLVEVPAEEADHIQTWLTATLGADVRIPDLSDHGLTFQGARLLVAKGQPVSQLVFTDADGAVVALCQMTNETPQDGFKDTVIAAFGMVSWGSDGSNFVVITDEGRPDLGAIAQTAAAQV